MYVRNGTIDEKVNALHSSCKSQGADIATRKL